MVSMHLFLWKIGMLDHKPFKVAFISDIHIDFYIPAGSNGYKLEKRMNDFIDTHLDLPHADVLVFAGDNSHYPQQNVMLLKLIAEKKIYKKIFITFGNHDMYLISNSQKHDFKLSWDKVLYAKKLYSEIDTVEFLDGNIVEVDGVKIGGTGMWYDYSYGIKKYGFSLDLMHQLWKDSSNDSHLIVGDDYANVIRDKFEFFYDNYGGRKRSSCTFNPLKFFEKEKEKMEKIVYDVDVFVSHMSPAIPPDLNPEHDNPVAGFYFFDGEQYLFNENAPKLWIFGHLHDRYSYKVGNTTLLSNPLGYKDQKLHHKVVVADLSDLDNFKFP